MVSKLTAQDDNQNKQFKPKIYQCKQREQMTNFYNRNYQNRYTSNSGGRRISFIDRIKYGQNYRDRQDYNQNYIGDFRRGNFRGNF